MKRLMVVLLLTLSAVVTIFTATSCKTMPVFGGPNIPVEPGLYMDLGYGFNSSANSGTGGGATVTYKPMFLAPGSLGGLDPNPLVILNGDEIKDIVPLPFRGSRIIIAFRMTPSEQENRSTIAAKISRFSLYPLSFADPYISLKDGSSAQREGGYYVCSKADIFSAISADKSNYDAGYIYLEIANIPPSPTGWYGFYFGGGLTFLQQGQ